MKRITSVDFVKSNSKEDSVFINQDDSIKQIKVADLSVASDDTLKEGRASILPYEVNGSSYSIQGKSEVM